MFCFGSEGLYCCSQRVFVGESDCVVSKLECGQQVALAANVSGAVVLVVGTVGGVSS